MAVVVKLGGSLTASGRLPALMGELARSASAGQPIVAVPGGGPFADAVRAAQVGSGFDDGAAHDMALLAMAQYGLMLAALTPRRARLAWGAAAVAAALTNYSGEPLIWLPDPRHDGQGLERSWRITADSLALWLAGSLALDRVLLVKTCAAPAETSLAALAAAGIVDAAYPELAARYPGVTTTVIYAAQTAALTAALAAQS